MNKKVVLVLLFILLFIPFSIKAQEYNKLKINTAFVTTADVSDIGKIYVQFQTYTNEGSKTRDVYLLKDNNYSTVINLEGGVLDASFIYGYCITYNDIPDRYGFMPITGKTSFNNDLNMLIIDLSIDFNTMNYDGKRYRENSDVTPQDFIDRKNGVVNNKSKKTSNNSNNQQEETTTTEISINEPIQNDPIVIGQNTTITTTTIVEDTNKNTTKESDEKKKIDMNYLIIIVSIVGGILIMFILFTFIKINQANKMV